MKFITTILGILMASIVLAISGDILYVQSDVVNMREAPSTTSEIVLKLQKGHKLVEFQRKGEWVQVGAARTEGKTGWIHSSLIRKEFIGGSTTAPYSSEFEKFEMAFNELNSSIKKKTGVTFFTKVENLGDGIIQVTATDIWLSGPKAARQSNLDTLFKIWDAADGSGLPIAVYVVDKNGKQQMLKNRW